MKSICIKELHEDGIYRDPFTKEKLERCKTSRVIQVLFQNRRKKERKKEKEK